VGGTTACHRSGLEEISLTPEKIAYITEQHFLLVKIIIRTFHGDKKLSTATAAF
jgi:hypothetical protein